VPTRPARRFAAGDDRAKPKSRPVVTENDGGPKCTSVTIAFCCC
jgi:hypothetical protein